jgi:RNA polymerase sigma factor (sigma-70 family)
MATGLPDLIRRLRVTMASDRLAEAADGDLLAAYARDRDDGAFGELVRRHGPDVLAECRRWLADPGAGDDAFQATFLVLARRAAAVRDPARLAGWLRGVARRVARRARTQTAKRAALERPLTAAGEPAAPASTPVADLRAVLAEELGRLPPAYREAVSACGVDGLTRREAARRLGIPVGTLSNRLARAHALLGRRLLRRGVALGVGLSVSAQAIANVSNRLVWQTVAAVTARRVPDRIASLATEASKPMISFRMVLATVIAGAALGTALLSLPDEPPLAAAPRLAPPADWPEPPDPKPVPGEYVVAGKYSRDGRYLALAQPRMFDGQGEHKVLLYDARTWKEVARLTGPTDNCFALDFSADGRTLYAACTTGTVYAWDTATGRPAPNLTGSFAVLTTPDGKNIVTDHFDVSKPPPRPTHLQIWDATTSKVLRKIDCDEAVLMDSLAFTPDGRALAGGYNNQQVGPRDFSGVIEWDLATGKELRRYDAVRITPGAFPITHAIAYTPDGKWLIVGGGEAVPTGGGGTMLHGYLWVFDRKTGKLEKTLIADRHDYVRKMHLSPDGRHLYAATQTAPRDVVRNGQKFRTSYGEVLCWDTRDWKQQWSQELDEGGTFWTLVPAPNGRRLVVATSGGVSLLDARTGERRGALVEVKRP